MRRFHPSQIVGHSEAMRDVLRIVDKAARVNATILLTGESGTGKGLIAQALHSASPRCDKPMVSLNCGAMPENLLESELFGHVRGAFTGADVHKKGLLEVADKGTVFLDEIGEMPLPMQVKLLHVLQERRFRRVGGVDEQSTDIRIIAATNRDLRRAIEEGLFREDLYYRLNVIAIELPPLRERRDDIPPLARSFLARFADQMRKTDLRLSPEAETLLVEYEWPGNIRELENAMERAAALSVTSVVDVDELPATVQQRLMGTGILSPTALLGRGFSLEAHVTAIERRYLAEALMLTGGVQVKAAAMLGMTFRSFRYYARKYQLRERRA